MRKIEQDSTPLAELVDDGFATTIGGMVDALTEAGYAVVVDDKGRLAVHAEVAATLRTERAEKRAQEAAEAAERARVGREAQAERKRVRQEQIDARKVRFDKVRKLERITGESTVMIERAYRDTLVNASDTGMSHAGRLAADERAVTLDELERWVTAQYGTKVG